MSFYKICPDCGANLDPGERCSCHDEEIHHAGKESKSNGAH